MMVLLKIMQIYLFELIGFSFSVFEFSKAKSIQSRKSGLNSNLEPSLQFQGGINSQDPNTHTYFHDNMRKQSFLGNHLLRTFSYARTLLFILFEESKRCANISP